MKLDVLAEICNLSTLEDRYRKGTSLRLAWATETLS